MRPSRLIDPADRLRLETAVIEAEQHTAGEIVVVVSRACDDYASAGWRLAVVLAALALLGVGVFVPSVPLLGLLAAQAAALVAGHALARLDPVRRRLIAPELIETRVSERARRAFAENGLARTEGRTGILVFVALLEHRVIVLADEGIHRALGPDERWQEVVDLVTAGLRDGRVVEGLLAGVGRCGALLAAHVPAAERKPDELPNAVVLED